MGHDQRDTLKDYWSRDEQYYTPFYHNTMVRDRFFHNSYGIPKRTWKWTKKLLFHLLDMTITNAYLLHKSCGGKMNTKRRSMLYFCKKCDVALSVVDCYEKRHARVRV
ncbi:hypothetical protein B7P43_G16282 [Cryptotermes secundus]|uniref:PiggyBac transposable element-derived protein domain-containing protein n=1 Tax=Cryptotermes secundus TaxID=105785 RepID=A0A2J7QR63_9NEOP|nr:hypothetical protein B7P43_G16282 [Cryptotermes secundus]